MLVSESHSTENQVNASDSHWPGVPKVRQRERTDCGVACLAMMARVPYEEAKQAFIREGLHVKRKAKPAFGSNFKELSAAAARLGLTLRRRKFLSWSDIQHPTILKVSNHGGRKGDWHWVVAHRTPTGIAIEDPATDIPSFENPDGQPYYYDFSIYAPTGPMLALCTIEKEAGRLQSHVHPIGRRHGQRPGTPVEN